MTELRGPQNHRTENSPRPPVILTSPVILTLNAVKGKDLRIAGRILRSRSFILSHAGFFAEFILSGDSSVTEFTLSCAGFFAEFTLSRAGFFAEFTLSEILRSLCSLRMTLTKASE
jgi:hypothetical protein